MDVLRLIVVSKTNGIVNIDEKKRNRAIRKANWKLVAVVLNAKKIKMMEELSPEVK
jgi:hypothetical protein